ncbi:MAG: cytochrome c oxidase subunit 3 [Actinobacteria bacterium]|nr:cytochrome c oxidase subunit 3 [Actinomycetota bacterium]MBW3642313.1 cytochrome c oxidase subunit 3 [Actinomycetota bacterium]
MAQPAAGAIRAGPPSGGPSMLAVGTVVWLASELMFFSGLFAGWFTLRAANAVWPPEGAEVDPLRTGLATVVLLASSFTMHAGTRAAEHGDRRRAVRWVLATVVMGSVFVTNQALEYTELDFTLSSHAYGSIFYLMTGFHGLHVIGGLGLMLAVIGVGTGRTRASLAEGLTVTEYYWHFVDVVWVGMFVTIYVLG